MDRTLEKLSEFPQTNHLLPTRLGNVLRVAKDQAPSVSTQSTVLLTRFDEVPAELRSNHDRYRSRIDMFCSLVAVFALLFTIVAVAAIVFRNQWGLRTGLMSGYLIAAVLAYHAAVANVSAYAAALQAIAASLSSDSTTHSTDGS